MATLCTHVHTYICTYIHVPINFIASFLWAPPVATQFLLFGHRQWRPLSFHCTDFIASFLWAPPVATQFSVLSNNIHKVRAPPVATLLCAYTHIPFDFIASFLWAPPVHSDSDFCCSGTASGDPQGVVTIESLKYHQSSPYIWGGAEHTRVHTCIHRKTQKKHKTKQNKSLYIC